MLRKLSYAPDDRLTYYVARIREIAAHDDAAATIEVDKLLAEVVEEYEDWEDVPDAALDTEEKEVSSDAPSRSISRIPGEGEDRYFDSFTVQFRIEKMTDLVEHLRRTCATNAKLTIYNLHLSNHYLREYHENIDASERYNAWSKGRYGTLIKEIEELEPLTRAKVIRQELERNLPHWLSSQAVLRVCKEVEQISPERMTQEHLDLLRQTRGRACWERARKKLMQARMADAMDSTVKAERLRKEAKLLLAQDWAEAFPDEKAPDVDTS